MGTQASRGAKRDPEKARNRIRASFTSKIIQVGVGGREAGRQKPHGEAPWLRQTLMAWVQIPVLP